MRRRAALILSLCLVLLGASAAWGEGEEKASPPESPGPRYSDGLPALPPGEQAFVLPPQQPPLPEDPFPPIPPPRLPAVEPPMLRQFIPQFAQLQSAQRVTVLRVIGKAPAKAAATNLTAIVRSPVPAGSAFAVSDNETPRPLDRVYATFAFFRVATLPAEPTGSSVAFLNGTASAPVTSLHIFNRPFDRSDVHQLRTDPVSLYQETFGFEKTFLDGNASIGVRMPVFQINGDERLGVEGVGDLTVVFKYALYNNLDTGDLFSTGLVVTALTGPNVSPAQGGSTLHATLLQPYVGGIFHAERLYVQGFSSLVVPTDARDSSLWLADVGAGYHLYSNPASDILTGIIPAVEAQFATALTHQGLRTPAIGAVDTIVLAGALHFTFHRLCFTAGASLPTTGPHPFDFSGFAQVNYAF